MTAPTLHLIPVDDRGSHQSDERCRCGPALSFRDLATGELAWRHRRPSQAYDVECVDRDRHRPMHRYFRGGVGWLCQRCCRPGQWP